MSKELMLKLAKAKRQKSEEQNSGSHASKASSSLEVALLRYQQSLYEKARQKRKPNELPAAKSEVVKLDAQLAENYKKALNALGLPAPETGEIAVDRRGFSAEVAGQLGDGYIGNNIIVACPEQSKLKLDDFTLDALLDGLFSAAMPAIECITPVEALYARIESNMQRLIAGSKEKLSIAAALKTPSSAVERVLALREGFEQLAGKPELLLSDSFSAAIAAKATKLSQLYDKGRIERLLAIAVNSFSFSPDIAKLNLQEFEVYYFGPGMIVCFPQDSRSTGFAIDGRRSGEALDALYGSRLIAFNESIARKKLGSEEECYSLVERIRKAGEERAFKELPHELKAALAQPSCISKCATALVQELLARYSSGALQMYKHYAAGFKSMFSSASPEKQEELLSHIMQLPYADDMNQHLNAWLRDTHGDLCAKLGIQWAGSEAEAKERGAVK